MEELKLSDIEVELPKLPPMGYGNDGYSVQAMHEYAVEYAYKFARQAVLAERERAAQIALAERVDAAATGDATDAAYNVACEQIAAAIRKG